LTHLARLLVLSACASALLVAAPVRAQGTAEPSDRVVATHGAWDIRCNQDNSICVLNQVGKGTAGNSVLEVRIRRLDGVRTEEGQTIPAAIQVAAPLGVLLQAGLRIQVDANEPVALPFQICVEAGCIVRDALPDAFVEQMKRGAVAKMTVVSPNQQPVSVDISLSGFTAGFNALDP